MRRQALSLLVENNPGVTSRISGLFSRRGFNIESFSAGETADPRYTRVTIVASGEEQSLEQIEKQLAKLEDVLDIKKLFQYLCSCGTRANPTSLDLGAEFLVFNQLSGILHRKDHRS